MTNIYIDNKAWKLSDFCASKNLHVGGWLDLTGTQITSLPEGLHVGGSLNLRDTQITSLPEGLHVGGSLYLASTQITSLPEGLHVDGSLDLTGTQITNVVKGGTDSRGYNFYGVKMRNGWRIIAGCRNLSLTEALYHWGSSSPRANAECLAIVEKICLEIEGR